MTFITKKKLNRRLFLRGAGTAIALPLLDSMIPALADAATSPASPIRMGFVYVPNGIIPSTWLPAAEGKDFELTPTLEPLGPYRDQLLVLSNLNHVNARALGDGAGDHARAGATFLTGMHARKTEGADIQAGISADQVAAQQLGKETQFASLELGIDEPSFAGGCDSGYSCAYTNTLSWRGPSTPNPVEVSPRAVFERLFGDGETTDPAARLKRLRENRSALDFVRDEIGRIQGAVGPRDKSKLEEYLESVRDIERRIQLAESQTNRPAPLMKRPAGIPDLFEDHSRLMTDLMVVAYQTDLTRVITYMMAREGSNRSFPELGISEGCHVVTHHQNDAEKIVKSQVVDVHRTKCLAHFVKRLSETQDGDATLLDRTMLLYGAGIRDGNAHDHDDLPLALIGGKAAGIRAGRHLKSKADTPMSNLLITMLDKMGVPCERLGDSTGKIETLSGV